nr:SWIM zinc finger family protein [uncultured Dyadobacter sp.]
MQYSREQILQLAPDDASAKAGRQLASRSKWITTGASAKALWGDCQGSGKMPYQTIIDLTNIAFKCSCPSRKFPCKHGLGLFLLYAEDPGSFETPTEPPAHVADWLEKRQIRDAAREPKEEKPVDEAARTKRAESREKKVNGGIEELRAWLSDIIRTGIMHVPQQAYQFQSNITARMVDAQAGGLANQLRQINQLNFFRDGWQQPLLKRLSGLYMITEGYLNRETLPPAVVRDLATIIGWTIPREEVLQSEPVTDHWIVLSLTTSEESNITTEKIWLYGSKTSRYALLLNFYAGNQPYQTLLFPGMQIEADIVYYPASVPMRALIRSQQPPAAPLAKIHLPDSLTDVYADITATLSQNTFMEQIPFMIEGIRNVLFGEQWYMTDRLGQSVPLANPEGDCWNMLAFSGGRLFSAFGVYEQGRFELHYIWTSDQAIFIKS